MSWWQLDNVLKERAQYADYYRSQVPVACPVDGTPLLDGPPGEPAVKYCPMGNFEYPRDYDPIVHSGM